MIVDFENEQYELDIEEIDLLQAMFIKSKTGFNITQWQEALKESDPDAIKALYWLMLEQSGKRMVWEKINFKLVKFLTAFGEAAKAEKEAEAEVEEDKPRPTKRVSKDS